MIDLKKLRSLAVAAALALLAAPAAATLAVSSSLELKAVANVGEGGPDSVAEQNVSQAATTGPLNASVSTQSPLLAETGGASILTQITGAATWESASKGQVLFTDIGWTISNANSTTAKVEPDQGAGWKYRFTTSSSGQFLLDWSITELGDVFALHDFEFVLFLIDSGGGRSQVRTAGLGDGSPIPGFYAGGLGLAGDLSQALLGGQTYEAAIKPFASIGEGPIEESFARMDGTFNWRITSGTVSEPATFALLGIGLLGLGALRRRPR